MAREDFAAKILIKRNGRYSSETTVSVALTKEQEILEYRSNNVKILYGGWNFNRCGMNIDDTKWLSYLVLIPGHDEIALVALEALVKGYRIIPNVNLRSCGKA